MFYRREWVSRGARLQPAWAAARGGASAPGPIPRDLTSLAALCDDLKVLLLSKSKNIKHRISLRFASELIYGISKMYESETKALLGDCVFVSNVTNDEADSEDEEQNIMMDVEENEDGLEAVRRLDPEHYSSIIEDEIIFDNEDQSQILPDITPPQMINADPSSHLDISQNKTSSKSAFERRNDRFKKVNKPHKIKSSNLICESYSEFIIGLELEAPLELTKRKYRKRKLMIDKFTILEPEKLKFHLRCNTPSGDVIKIKKQTDLMSSPSQDKLICEFLLKRYRRNLHTTPKDMDEGLFSKSIPSTEDYVEGCNSPDRFSESLKILNDENLSDSDIAEESDKHSFDDIPINVNAVTSTPKSLKEFNVQNDVNFDVINKRKHQSLYVVYPKNVEYPRITDLTIFLSYQPIHNLIMERNDTVISSRKRNLVGDYITAFQLREEWSEKGVMEKLERLWTNKKKSITVEDIIAIGQINERPGLSGSMAISSLTKLKQYHYIVLIKDRSGNVCDIIRGPAAFWKHRSYT